METEELREKLHVLIMDASKEKLEEIYDLFCANDYSDEFKAMLDSEFNEYEIDGQATAYEEVNKVIKQMLRSEK